jgi:hypothetical protein
MSDNSNVTVEGEIDAGFTSYFDPDEHGQNGETVWASDDDAQDGDMRTDWWPSEVDADPDDLNESQKKVIRYCVFNDVENMSFKAISQQATPDMSRAYANNVLKSYWPAKREEISPSNKRRQNRKSDPGKAIESAEKLESVRKGLLNGDTTAKYAQRCGIARNTVGEYARGIHTDGIEDDCSIPPLEWNTDENEYVVSNAPVSDEVLDTASEAIQEQKDDIQQEVKKQKCQQSIDELTEILSVQELTEALANATNSSVEEIHIGANDMDVEPPHTSERVNKQLETALTAMKATAQHEETKDALEVVEEYL